MKRWLRKISSRKRDIVPNDNTPPEEKTTPKPPPELSCPRVHLGSVSLVGLNESGERGCMLCRQIIDAVEAFNPTWTAGNLKVKKVELDLNKGTWGLYEEDQCVGSFTLHYKSEDEDVYKRDWRRYSEQSLLEKTMFGNSLAVAENSNSKAAFDRVRWWLSAYGSDDGEGAVDSTAGPRRLLHLGRDQSAIRLVEFQDCERLPKYVCLSYCWGSDLTDVLVTTKDNIAEHIGGIRVSKLAKTIADAVTVCRELEIPHLWVDSLCIIQGDGLDFATEGSKMDSIFSNSYLTIYAEYPTSCKEGFLGPQSRGNIRWQWLAPSPAPSGIKFFVRNEDRNRDQGKSPWKHGTALDRRAWCLQESMLPRRKLMYFGTEMVWQYGSESICECGHFATSVSGRFQRKDQPQPWPFSCEDIWQWRTLIENYSGRSLSDPTDKLSAVAGLAKRTRLMDKGDRYYAGLWESEFLNELFWQVLSNSPCTRLINGVSTWSWASIEGPITWPRPELGSWTVRHPVAVIHEINCRPFHPAHPVGPVEAGGYLNLTAPLVPLKLAVPVRNPHGYDGLNYLIDGLFTFCAGDILIFDRVVLDVEKEVTTLPFDILQCEHTFSDYEQSLSSIHQLILAPETPLKQCNYENKVFKKQYFGCQLYRYTRTKRRRIINEDVVVDADDLRMQFLLLEKGSGRDNYRRVGIGYCEMKQREGGLFSRSSWNSDIDIDSTTNNDIVWPVFQGSTAQRIHIV
ncbi:heterokaryon incompatibility protein-domain-containing protein [Ilyonectria destructans]|nr:heterokaryon incompatibility protein-domain-containing protein [Ilyonectria destructans]